LLQANRLDEIEAMADTTRGLTSALLSRLYQADACDRWRAAEAVGRVAGRLWARQPGQVERLLAKLVWALNDESGATGWGVPQALGEVVRNDAKLARDYLPLLQSYLDSEDIGLGTDILVHGTVYAIGRVGEAHPELAGTAGAKLERLLHTSDATTRGLAAWALGRMQAPGAWPLLVGRLTEDDAAVQLYEGGNMRETTVGQIAHQTLQRMAV
jgi:hypothetical protein